MAKKTWTIKYIDYDTPSLDVEAESFAKAVEKVKDKLAGAALCWAHLESANLSGFIAEEKAFAEEIGE